MNRFGFFQSFKNQIAPNGKVDFQIQLENDNNVLFRARAAAAGRYIIEKFVLWVPKMEFNPEGRQMWLEKYLKTHTWSYLNESIVTTTTQLRKHPFSIRKPRLVFVWVLNNAKMNDPEQNMFVFDTYNIPGAAARTITSARLKLGTGT